MGLWIEIHCGIKATGCYSNSQTDVPMTMTRNTTIAAVNQSLYHLRREAEALGWKFENKDWICPNCYVKR